MFGAGFVIIVLSNVTAPLKVVLVPRVAEEDAGTTLTALDGMSTAVGQVWATIVPLKNVLVPRIAELPTWRQAAKGRNSHGLLRIGLIIAPRLPMPNYPKRRNCPNRRKGLSISCSIPPAARQCIR